MTYSSLMVNMDLAESNEAVLLVAATLARRFNAHVVGIAAAQPLVLAYADGSMAGGLIDQDRETLATEAAAAETRFRAVLHDAPAGVEWRSGFGFGVTAEYVARQSRAADLIITGPGTAGSALEPARQVDVGELVLQAGRPVLVVPATAAGQDAPGLALRHGMIGWKEGREARRALADALPLLAACGQVTLACIVSEDERATALAGLTDVCAWLSRHGIAADRHLATTDGDDAVQLEEIATRLGADLLVAGAYGRSRLREWALGGVTRDMLMHPARCTLLSH